MVQCRSSAAGIRECDALERDSRATSPRLKVARVRCLGDERPRGKQIEDAARGGDAEQALVEELAELAERAEDLDAEHQDDEQDLDAELAALDPRGAVCEGDRGADRDAGDGHPVGRGVAREHAHRRTEDGVGPALEAVPACAALPERLERR